MPLAQSYDEGKSQVEQLVERFARKLDAYTRVEYKEAQVRAEFIDPLFEALGWDVRNTRGYAEQYKDVVHEDVLKVGGAVQAPDYCFRIGGTRKFFLEAKKPSVSVKGDVGPAYQLRRYAWSAKLPLSILTDFEEFAVYDCRSVANSEPETGAHGVRAPTGMHTLGARTSAPSAARGSWFPTWQSPSAPASTGKGTCSS
jgi:predicted type IV restriction endonuclease